MSGVGPAPRVSIIVPFLNPPEPFFREALEGVRSQTFEDWELLLVDDGSTDGSSALAAAFARECGKTRVLNHPHGETRGISASRALAAAHARGELIAPLDADDVWLPEKLERQVHALDRHPRAAMVYGIALYWRSWESHAPNSDFVPAAAVPVDRLLEPPGPLPLFLTGRAPIPAPCSVIVRRGALEAVGGFEDPTTGGAYEDQILYTKLCHAFPVLVHPGTFEWYRVHAGSLTGRLTAGAAKERRRAYLLWLDAYLRSHPPVPRVVRRALRNELWLLDRPRAARVARTLRRIPARVRTLIPSTERSFP
jgi:glycosyltransferase involved in cell wall biosynthesis